MMRIYLIALLIAGGFFWWHWKNAPDEAERRRLVRNAILYGLLAIIFVLAALGRIHWLGAIFAALFPILKFVFSALLRFSPALAQIYAKRQNSGATDRPSESTMSLEEARQILEVSEGASKDEIQIAYKKQIQKVHPDKGGSAYFASKLNEARDRLLKNL